jgi:hypothetical protein
MVDGFRPTPSRQLWDSGFDTGLYDFELLPAGNRRILLEKSAWHRNQPAVVWFFLDLESGVRYRISIFKNKKRTGYGPEGLDLSTVPPGTSLSIEIRESRVGTFRIEKAQIES